MSEPNEPNYPQVPPTEPVPAPPASPWAPAQPPPLPSSGRGFPVRRLAIGIGALAVVAGGVFAVQSFTGGDSGAATPEEAATRLVDAFAEEDVLGVVDLLPEGERDLLQGLLTDARDEYQRLGVLSETFSLDGFQGVDITAEDVEVDVEEITDGLALVTITDGEFAVEVDGDELTGNLGNVVEAIADEREIELEVDDVDEETDADELNASFAVVEEDGRWFPSVGFTIAEFFRGFDLDFDEDDEDEDDADVPDLDDGVQPEGADSPEAAIQSLLDAAVGLDPEAAIAILDPGEMRALQVYSQFFELERGEADDVTIEAELTDAEVEGISGGASRVIPTGLEIRFESDDDGTGEVVLEDGCLSVDIQPGDDSDEEPFAEEFCFAEEDGELLPDEIGEVEVPPELQEVADALLPLQVGVVTVERDGEHFVAPLRTVGDFLLGLTRGLEREDLEEGGAVFDLLSGELDDELEDLFGEVEETTGFEDEDVFDDEIFDDDEAAEDCEGVGCGFEDDEVPPADDEEDDEVVEQRVPTGASGQNGELLVFDVVEGSVAQDETATFTAVADIDGQFIVGAQGDDLDSVITVLDAATGEVLAENDDFNGFDPEVLIDLVGGQVITIEVRGFAGDPGTFVVYFEPF